MAARRAHAPRSAKPTALDAGRLTAAYARVRPRLATDPTFAPERVRAAELRRFDTRMKKPPADIEHLAGWLDGSDRVRYAGLAVLFEAFGRSAKPRALKGDLHVGRDETSLLRGDLHVKGNLTLDDGAMLFVLGSLRVDGYLAHVGDFSVVAAHDLSFASGVTTGELIALAGIDAGDKLYLAHNDHSCRARAVRVGLLVDFERESAFGKVTAEKRLTKWSFASAARALGVAGDGELAEEVAASLARGGEPVASERPLTDEDLWDAARTDEANLATFVAARTWPAKTLEIALAYAAEWGNLGAVRTLLARGARASDEVLAASAASAETLGALLDASGKSPDVMVGGQPLLHLVVNVGGEKGVRALLDRGATVDATNRAGATALHVCAHHGYVKIAKILLARGARKDLTTEAAWHDFAPRGATPRDVAERQLDFQSGGKPWRDLVKLLG